jgi:hypothetical protein
MLPFVMPRNKRIKASSFYSRSSFSHVFLSLGDSTLSLSPNPGTRGLGVAMVPPNYKKKKKKKTNILRQKIKIKIKVFFVYWSLPKKKFGPSKLKVGSVLALTSLSLSSLFLLCTSFYIQINGF